MAKTLVIGKALSGNTILVKRWKPGDLGIMLKDAPAPTPEAPVINGDFKKKVDGSGTSYVIAETGYVSDGVEAGAQDYLLGTQASEVLNGLVAMMPYWAGRRRYARRRPGR